VGVADPFDAMINDRPYWDAMPVAAAFDVVEEEAGRQFDPRVSAAPRRREQRAQVQDSGTRLPECCLTRTTRGDVALEEPVLGELLTFVAGSRRRASFRHGPNLKVAGPALPYLPAPLQAWRPPRIHQARPDDAM